MAKEQKIKAGSNVYTALLAVSLLAVVATAVYVTLACYSNYETIFKVSMP